jgi:hypothetical protein
MSLLLVGTILLQQATVVKMGESGATTLYKYNIYGTIFCSNHTPLQGLEIDLWEEDLMNANDHLGSTRTDSEGHFEINGEEDEGNEPELCLKIIHHPCIPNWLVSIWIRRGVAGGKILRFLRR